MNCWKTKFNKSIACSKEVEVDGIIYSSVKEAATALGCKDSSPLCKALKAGRQFKGHNVKYVNQQPNQ